MRAGRDIFLHIWDFRNPLQIPRGTIASVVQPYHFQLFAREPPDPGVFLSNTSLWVSETLSVRFGMDQGFTTGGVLKIIVDR